MFQGSQKDVCSFAHFLAETQVEGDEKRTLGIAEQAAEHRFIGQRLAAVLLDLTIFRSSDFSWERISFHEPDP